MKIYLVGGAVRDHLLKRPVTERDWVVVGATVTDMLKLGYRQVGKEFPVFLHPQTHEEYALARIERKVGAGYKGFIFDVSATVSLEEDLSRRDLTINAMAETAEGQLIDPYGGRSDLEKGILRHVSPAFIEDPVRVLRVARFAARFGFAVADETLQLMRAMVKSGEINALVPERVWKEVERALGERYPEKFFQVLESAHALAILFPAIEISALITAAQQEKNTLIRFAVLLQKLSAHEIKNFCDRYRVPNDYRELALMVVTHHEKYATLQNMQAANLVDWLQALDIYRRTERFEMFLSACEIIYPDLKNSELLRQAAAILKSLDISAIAAQWQGAVIAEKIREERIKILQQKM